MRSGSGLGRSCRVKLVTPAAPGVTTGFLSKRFFGLRVRARHGAICRKRPASGLRRILASRGGRRRAFGSAFSRRSATIPISNMSSSTAHSSGSTSMALVDALGNLIRFLLLPGQRHDSIGVEPLITGLDFEALIGDKAFDNNWLRANLNERGAIAVIPSKADRAKRIPHDAEMYKWRHLVENFFCHLKAFRRIATRYEKTDTCFAGFLNLVALFLACR